MRACLQNWRTALFLCTPCALASACQMPRQTPAPPTEPAAQADPTRSPAHRSELDQQHDLHLFGQSDGTAELTFETRAATNIQQHTRPGDGADFDPHIDPTGRIIAFASTRNAEFSQLYVKAAEGAAMTQITDEQANDAQPCFSPDGRFIAFTSDRAGHWDIWVIDANGRNPRQITNSPMPELHPSWSPDGKQLVYCRVNPKQPGGELWIADIENPGVKRLIGEGLFPAWSPGGTKIAYQRSRARGSRWFSIWTLQLVDGEAMYPTEIASSTEAALIAPCWSPDGRQIAFVRVPQNQTGRQTSFRQGQALRIDGRGRADIGIVDTDGRGMQRLTNGSGENYSPAWSVDGRIYFTARRGGMETIWSLKPFTPNFGDSDGTGEAGARQAMHVLKRGD